MVKRFLQKSDFLVLGLGTSILMWDIGYVCRIPPVVVPGSVVLLLMIMCLFIGGFMTGRLTSHGWKGGLMTGAVTSTLNLLILGSLIGGGTNTLATLLWLPGSYGISMLLGALGAAVSSSVCSLTSEQRNAFNWTNAFCWVMSVATLSLIFIGGLVTSKEAGLAVVDWPNTEGMFMFLYPLSRMTGGIYYEHSHRLFGSLVGLTTLLLTLHLFLTDARRWLKVLMIFMVIGVITQGILGGLRVTGHFTFSTSINETIPNIFLAMVHGILGQTFFAGTVALAVFTSTLWKNPTDVIHSRSCSIDRALNLVMILMVFTQLIIGAVLRHSSSGLLLHISMAMVVLIVALACGVRAWGLYELPLLKRMGLSLLAIISIQITLGLTALVVTGGKAELGDPGLLQTLIPTLHQMTGALVLAFAVKQTLWFFRLVQLPALSLEGDS